MLSGIFLNAGRSKVYDEISFVEFHKLCAGWFYLPFPNEFYT